MQERAGGGAQASFWASGRKAGRGGVKASSGSQNALLSRPAAAGANTWWQSKSEHSRRWWRVSRCLSVWSASFWGAHWARAMRKTAPVSRAQKNSQRALTLATTLFVLCSGFAVYVLSTMVTTTLTELVYFVDTKCVVHQIRLHEEPVPCIVPSCGNILTQSGCRQTGYCIRVALNFSIKDEHAELHRMPVEHTSWAPMADLKLHSQYKRAHGNDAEGTGGIPCVGFEAGVEGDRKCCPTKTYDTAMYAPSVAVTLAATAADVAEADGRKLELIDPTDSGRCFAISCREDGELARREALELMSYWPVGSTLPSCHYLRSFSPVRTAATPPPPTSDPKLRPHPTTAPRCHPSCDVGGRVPQRRQSSCHRLEAFRPDHSWLLGCLGAPPLPPPLPLSPSPPPPPPPPPLPPLPARLHARPPAHSPPPLQFSLPAAQGTTRTAVCIP